MGVLKLSFVFFAILLIAKPKVFFWEGFFWGHVMGGFISVFRLGEHFTLYSPADLFNRTPSRFLWDVLRHAEINARREFVHNYPQLSIAGYSFLQLQE